jgi:glycine/serine hydroxymethyltransferase
LKEKDMVKVAKWMNDAIAQVEGKNLPKDKEERKEYWKDYKAKIWKNKELLKIASEVKSLMKKYPLP